MFYLTCTDEKTNVYFCIFETTDKMTVLAVRVRKPLPPAKSEVKRDYKGCRKALYRPLFYTRNKENLFCTGKKSLSHAQQRTRTPSFLPIFSSARLRSHQLCCFCVVPMSPSLRQHHQSGPVVLCGCSNGL